jgi:hypothetical protein
MLLKEAASNPYINITLHYITLALHYVTLHYIKNKLEIECIQHL